MTDFLHNYMPFLFYNPLLTLAVLLVLIIVAFIVDSKLKKLNEKLRAKRLEEITLKDYGR